MTRETVLQSLPIPAPVGTDNCTGAITTQTAGLVSGATFPVGTTTNTFEVTDAAGNGPVDCSFTVTVNDTENPSVTCPSNVAVSNDAGQCSAVINYTLSSSDNCAVTSTSQTGGLASGAGFSSWDDHKFLYRNGCCRNMASCSFTVTVNDTENPGITCPANITTSNDANNCNAVVNYTAPLGTDNCPSANTALTAGLGDGGVFPIGTNTETYTVTDASGNMTSCSFTVTVNDTENPSITCPPNVTLSNDAGACGAVVTYSVSTSDNCPGESLAQTGGQATNTLFPIGTTTNSFTVTDASSNVANCSFTVTINDAENPTIVCPGPFVANNDAGICGAVVNYTAPVGTDNCPAPTTAAAIGNLGPGATFPVGMSTETFTVTDASGNTASCDISITVNDNENPTITCPANITVGQ